MRGHGRILNAYFEVNKTSLNWLHNEWCQLHDILGQKNVQK